MAGKLILNRYRPMSQAGSGGFSTVQVAWDTLMQRKVAIKMIQLDEQQMRDVLAAAREEIDRPNALAHEGWELDEYGNQQAFYDDAYDAYDDAYDDGSSYEGGYDVFDPYDDFDSLEALPEHMLIHLPGIDEARTVAGLSDPNIAQMYDFQVQGLTAYLIMEYVEGVTLTKFVRHHREDVTPNIIAAVFQDVAHALQVAHGNQVLHLDIKPDNVIINRQGQAKVTDFGLATFVDAQGNGHAVGGTVGFMPPEQLRQEPLDARCDEWALASMMYYLMSGQCPFLAKNLEEAESVIENAELVLPSVMWEEYGDEVDDVMFLALDPDREERYGSVAEFAEALQPLLGNPRSGRKQLAVLVGNSPEDFGEGYEDYDEYDGDGDGFGEDGQDGSGVDGSAGTRVSWRERMTDRVVKVATRVFACVATGFVSLLAGSGIAAWSMAGATDASAMLGSPVLWVVFALGLVAALIKPRFGVLYAFGALGIGLILRGALILGILMMMVAAAWFFLSDRKCNAEANTLLAFPVAAMLGLSPAAAVVAGYFHTVKQTMVNVVFGVVSLMVLSSTSLAGALVLTKASADDVAATAAGATSQVLEHIGLLPSWSLLDAWGLCGDIQAAFLQVCSQPYFWAIAAGWVIAAVILSFGCDLGRRWTAVAGAAIGGVIQIAITVASAAFLTGGNTAMSVRVSANILAQAPSIVFTVVCVAAGIALCVIHVPNVTPWLPPLEFDDED